MGTNAKRPSALVATSCPCTPGVLSGTAASSLPVTASIRLVVLSPWFTTSSVCAPAVEAANISHSRKFFFSIRIGRKYSRQHLLRAQNHRQPARAVHAAYPRHLNVTGRRRPGDRRHRVAQPRAERTNRLRHSAHHLAAPHHANMVVGQQRQHAPALRSVVHQKNRSR